MKLLTQPRGRLLAGFLVCAGLIADALYLQQARHLEPCPLCIFQRIAFFAAALAFLAGSLHNPRRTGLRVYAAVALLCNLVGAGIAMRHVWIQHLPADQIPSCGPDLSYMLDTLPLQSVITTVLKGSGECAEVTWTFLGLSMPAWALVFFLLLAGYCVYLLQAAPRLAAKK